MIAGRFHHPVDHPLDHPPADEISLLRFRSGRRGSYVPRPLAAAMERETGSASWEVAYE
jgi:hypothetical protein